MKTSEVIAYLDEVMKPEYQEDYDNSGFLLGDSRSDYRGALVALDMTEAVADEAIAGGFNLIVTHHPFIFRGVRRLTDRDAAGRVAMRLIEHGICLYAAHTNLDNLPWGVNGALAARLGLEGCRVLRKMQGGHQGVQDDSIGAGLVGELAEPTDAEPFLQKVKAVTGIPFIRTSQFPLLNSRFSIKKIAICGGSGADFIGDALAAGADAYLTADLKYHDFQRTDGRMLLADIGHYESEQFAKDVIFSVISEKFSNFACRISDVQQGIVSYI